ncbi:MAG: hypothetical protein JXB88_18385 [Spirochaetales bacterium]|nr:hypothetical protein [Spirochaetales bacterium]
MVIVITTGKEFYMSEMNDYKGLCSTCALADTCTYQRNQKEIIWQCEEFSERTSPDIDLYSGKKTVKAATITGQKRTESEEELIVYKGLCVNCENRNVCKEEIVEGGIWHCENYE